MGKRNKRRPQRQSEAGFPWKGRQGTRDANSRHDPQHYLRPRQTIGQSQRNKETGEPDDATSIQSGSAGGWEKRPEMDLARSLPSFYAPRPLFLTQTSPAFLLSKKTCVKQKFRHFRVGQQYPEVI